MTLLRALISWLRMLLLGASSSASTSHTAPDGAPLSAEERRSYEERIAWLDAALKARSERLYELDQHYSSEHFKLQESMRNLKIEEMRNAGLFADRETILQRCNALQERIRELKARLRRYEAVDDRHFDEAPVIVQTPKK